MEFLQDAVPHNVVTFLLLSIWISLVGIQPGTAVEGSLVCPRLCHCDWTQEFSVHCIGQLTARLTTVPPLPYNVTNLEFSFNAIRNLSEGSFPGRFPALRRLVFHGCGLQELGPGTFINLPNLVELSLDHNRLRLIPSRAFYGLSKIRSLSLNNNDLIRLDGGTFAGLFLSHLNLHDNPRLTDVSKEVFSNASVETLSLDRCSIKDIPVGLFSPLVHSLRILHWSNSPGLVLPPLCLSGLRLESLFLTQNALGDAAFLADDVQATHVFLGGNRIHSVDLSLYPSLQHTETLALNSNDLKDIAYNDVTMPLPFLKELDLSNNSIKDLSSSALGAMPNLTTLDVSHNALTNLAPSLRPVFHKLHFLDVSGNNIACNCSMEWYRQWLHSLDPSVIVYGKTCRMDSFFNKSQQCEGPNIVQLADTSNDMTFSFVCTARGLPLPSLTWRLNVTHLNDVTYSSMVSSVNDASATMNTSKLIIVKSAVKVHRCLAVECFANNSMGVMHRKLRHCLKVDTSSLLAEDDVMHPRQPNLAPIVALAVIVSLTFVSVTVLSKCARGLYVRWKERHAQPPHVSQRSLINTHEEEVMHNFSDDTDV